MNYEIYDRDRYNRKIYGQRWHTMSPEVRERYRQLNAGNGYIKPTLMYRIKKIFKNMLKRLREI